MSNGISFTCDSCGREVYGCNIVNGMKFCAKCYQETFGNHQKYIDMLNKESSELLVNSLAEKDRQITELKKQLQERSIIEKISYLINYLVKKQEFEYCDFCERNQCLGMMEDYEIEDMDEFFEKYKFMKIFSYSAIYELQKYYNSEFLSAGWCGCTSPENLAEISDRFKGDKK